MPVIRTETYAKFTDLLDELENRTLMLRAFGVLLECAMRDANNFFPDQIADGTYMLLDQQFKTLDFLGSSIRDQYYELRSSKLEVNDIDAIARASGVPKGAVLSVLSIATGIPKYHFERKGETA